MRTPFMLSCVAAMLATALPGGGALALDPVDPQADGVGVYFDAAGTIASLQTTVPREVVPAWLLITRASSPGGIGGFSVLVTWEATDPRTIVWANAVAGALCLLGESDLCCGVEPPLPWAPAVVIGRLQVVVPSPEASARFFLGPSDWCNGLVYGDGGDPSRIVPLRISSGSPDMPVAVINGAAPVAVEGATWGALKSLYQ